MFDVENYERQYKKYYRPIYLYCLSHVGNAHMAEDVTQETFLGLYKFMQQNKVEDAQYLVYRIARNACIDVLRKNEKRNQINKECLGLADERLIDIANDIMEEQILSRLAVHKALFKLTPIEREIIFLRYVNDIPIRMIMDLCGISRFRLYKHLEHAKNSLYEILKKEGLFDDECV